MKILHISACALLLGSCGGVYSPDYLAPYGKANPGVIDEFTPTISNYDNSQEAYSINYQYNPNKQVWLEGDENESYGQVSLSITDHSYGRFFIGASLRYEQGSYRFNNRISSRLTTKTYRNLGLSMRIGLNPVELNKTTFISPLTAQLHIDIGIGPYSYQIGRHDDLIAGSASDTGIADVRGSDWLAASIFSELRKDINRDFKFYLRLGYSRRGMGAFEYNYISKVESKHDLFATIALQYQKFGIFTVISQPINRQEVTRPSLGLFWQF